ncbi:TetR/AcrR family transcriptional regulator [Kineothrix sedimenti]|uniref:TetR/AcrR family transcriptional regulator n=1 Tax=Kineothrix sedimenti TaxID=3123317 RepID=A0ABZ3EW73_9FIRM
MMEYKLHRKESLIITAIDIIDELGIQGLSTREIARREGVSEATLFRHYSNKKELLRAILDYFCKFDYDIFQSAELMKLKPCDSIRFFVKLSVEYYENYPAITSIMQVFEAVRYESDLEGKIKEILNNRTGFIKQLIEKAKEEGELSKDINSEDLADLISGLCREICLKWRINDRNFSLKERTMETLDMVLNSLYSGTGEAEV